MVAEALDSFITYTFNNTLITKIEAFHMMENPASGRVLQKVGMRVVVEKRDLKVSVAKKY